MLVSLRKYIIAGLLVWVPVGITILVIKLLIELLDKSLLLLPPPLRPEALFGVTVPGLGIIISIIFVLATGFLIANLAGRSLIKWGEHFLSHIPLVRSIYSAVKQVTETILTSDKNSFRQVLLLEYPRRGVWTIGFLTSDGAEEIEEKTGEKLLTVFVPTTPNPTSGFILMIPEYDVKKLDIEVEDALKLVVSLGVVMPQTVAEKKEKKKNQNRINNLYPFKRQGKKTDKS